LTSGPTSDHIEATGEHHGPVAWTFFRSNLHYSMRHIRNVIIAGILGAMVSGGVYAFWSGFKANAAPPAALATPRQPKQE